MLKIENLNKKYKNFEVLKNVNLTLNKNQIYALIGLNGAGKTTLVDCICKIKKMDSGKVFIDDIEISSKKNFNSVKKILGYMPQSFALFNDLTVEENLKYLSSVYNISLDKVDDVINLCSLENYKKVLAQNLSGGYRQLLSLAGSIIHNPKLLILDEPTSAMDPVFRDNFWKIIKEFKTKEKTVLVITHYIEDVLKCDKCFCLKNGTITEEKDISDDKMKLSNNMLLRELIEE